MSASRPEQPPEESLLHALADGQLPEARRAELGRLLDAHPDERVRVACWSQQNELIRALFDDVAQESVPERLALDRLRRPARNRAWQAVAAALLLVVLGGAGGWTARSLLPPPMVPVDAAEYGLEAHRVYASEVRHAVEVGAGEQQHLVSWLSKRLAHPLRVPDLNPLGLELLGGRLLVTPGGAPAAQLMYQDATGLRLTLYVTRHLEPRETAFRWAEEGGVGAFYWQEPDMGYAIIAALPRARLLEISERIYEQIED